MLEGMHGGMCGYMHHKMGPLLIVLIGLVFLLKALGYMEAGTAYIAWPVLLILAGMMKMSCGMCKCCK